MVKGKLAKRHIATRDSRWNGQSIELLVLALYLIGSWHDFGTTSLRAFRGLYGLGVWRVPWIGHKACPWAEQQGLLQPFGEPSLWGLSNGLSYKSGLHRAKIVLLCETATLLVALVIFIDDTFVVETFQNLYDVILAIPFSCLVVNLC